MAWIDRVRSLEYQATKPITALVGYLAARQNRGKDILKRRPVTSRSRI
ncbi:hypothetical protein ACFYNY_32830 [Streptomyces sp. NPDC006530]